MKVTKIVVEVNQDSNWQVQWSVFTALHTHNGQQGIQTHTISILPHILMTYVDHQTTRPSNRQTFV